MRILYIHQYYKTPEEGGAIRSYYIASALVQAGHEVVMITSHNRERYQERDVEGIQVHYLPVQYTNEFSSLERSKAFLRFLRQARTFIGRLQPFDICYVTSTPLTVGLLGIYAKQRYKIPYIFEVRDLWPEAPIQLGYIRNPALRSALRKLESNIYAGAKAIVALSPGIAQSIQKTSPKRPVHMIPNMSDCDFFKPAPKNPSFARIFGVEDAFVISYFGSAGPSNHLEYLLHAAQACQLHQLPVKFLIAASGSHLYEIKQQAEETRAENVVFVPYGSKQQVQNWLTITDAIYTSFAPYPVLETNSPNKFFDGLAAGKLSIVNTRGWLKELVEKYRCGFYANPEDPEEFVSLLKGFLENDILLEEYQANARKLAVEQFSRTLLTQKVVKLIEELGQ